MLDSGWRRGRDAPAERIRRAGGRPREAGRAPSARRMLGGPGMPTLRAGAGDPRIGVRGFGRVEIPPFGLQPREGLGHLYDRIGTNPTIVALCAKPAEGCGRCASSPTPVAS